VNLNAAFSCFLCALCFLLSAFCTVAGKYVLFLLLWVIYSRSSNFEERFFFQLSHIDEIWETFTNYKGAFFSITVAYLNMGTSLIALGRCREAAAILREGSKLDGHGLRDRTAHDNAKISALLQLANLYADQDKLQRAVAIYREALHVLPEHYPPQVSRPKC
jgi:tetratricopeptide (TPR) repeat protein